MLKGRTLVFGLLLSLALSDKTFYGNVGLEAEIIRTGS